MAVYFQYFCLCTKPSQTKSGHMLNTTFFTTRLIWLKENKKKAGTVNCSSHIAKYSRTQFCYWASCMCVCRQAVFLFLYFLFRFYKNIFLSWKITEIYPGRPAAGRPGLTSKKKAKKICRPVPGDRSPGSRAAGLPGRPATGRPAPRPI